MTGTSFYICPVVFSGLHVSSMFVCRKLVLNTNHVQATGGCWQWHLFRLRIIASPLLYRVSRTNKMDSFREFDGRKMCVVIWGELIYGWIVKQLIVNSAHLFRIICLLWIDEHDETNLKVPFLWFSCTCYFFSTSYKFDLKLTSQAVA